MVVTHKEDDAAVDATSQSPPPYEQGPSGSTSPVLLRRVAPPIPPCNHVAIKRPSGAKVAGSFVIDPELEIPTELLAPVEEGQERKHLMIDVPNSQVDVDVWVVEGSLLDDGAKHPTTNVDVRGNHVNMRLVSLRTAG